MIFFIPEQKERMKEKRSFKYFTLLLGKTKISSATFSKYYTLIIHPPLFYFFLHMYIFFLATLAIVATLFSTGNKEMQFFLLSEGESSLAAFSHN